jgi:hypothetical protein
MQQKLLEQQQQFKSKETRMQLTQDRLNKKILDLEKRNRELQDEVKILEKERASVLEMRQHMEKNFKTSNEHRRESVGLKPKATETATSQKNERYSLGGMRKSASVADLKRPALPQKVTLKKASSNSSLSEYTSKSEPKKVTEFDSVKAEMDRVQLELGLRRCSRESTLPDGSRERVFHDGTRLIYYLNGNYLVEKLKGSKVLYYANGDMRTVCTNSSSRRSMELSNIIIGIQVQSILAIEREKKFWNSPMDRLKQNIPTEDKKSFLLTRQRRLSMRGRSFRFM